MADRLPTYFVSHGGGPWPYMSGEFRNQFQQLEQSLKNMRLELGDAPKAVLVVSGHWEEQGFQISSGVHPGMVYDYHGFADYLYQIKYAAPGSPELAQRVQSLLSADRIDATLNPTRGFDHGTFSIMKPLYPNEDIPVVQLSLDAGMDPALHLRVGKALAPLREEGVLIIGSGFSFHNLRIIRSSEGHEPSRQFDAWLRNVLLEASPDDRERHLLRWEEAPMARLAHPHEDHLLPLMVTVGAAWDEPATTTYHQTDFFGGLTASSFRFGSPPQLSTDILSVA
ncbi:DODA-type extradiol aromatic ring-opening family dioxygenase [Oryzifoliimicrobium ureilyticus]|uniref:DODA-type extradiol aromatic ring-opening family dioxygenase n=1 Tax=Oryzifoliimicrobium ureilyticus TaxID=3113724 RepID=UPI0030761A75